jgi:hypothetical protein
MLSPLNMAKGRRAKPYKDGTRKQMTLAWKKRVLAALDENKRTGKQPANLAQLASVLKADKRGIYVTFDVDAEPPQMSSVYVDDICELLNIAPPMLEASTDDELEKDLQTIRTLSPEDRRALIEIAQRMVKR